MWSPCREQELVGPEVKMVPVLTISELEIGLGDRGIKLDLDQVYLVCGKRSQRLRA
jgi:hypothetical protein